MIELQLIYEGGGRFRTATKIDHALAEDKLGAGEMIEAQVGKRRSGKQNRWFHAMVAAAFDNQTTGPRFDDAERLRKWLLIRADHCDVKQFEPGAITREVARWLRDTYGDIDFSTDNRWIYAKTARSIAWANCDHDTMCAVADKVVDVIVEQIVPGTTRQDWEPFINEARNHKVLQPAAGLRVHRAGRGRPRRAGALQHAE